MKLPKELFVRIVTPENGTASWFQTNLSEDDVMDGEDGPEDIGVYRLVETKRLHKVITPVSTPRKRRVR